MPDNRGRQLLLLLFLIFIGVELMPIVLFAKWDALWLLNNGEDFDFLFWPPLNVAFTPSFFYYHVGAVSWSVMKPVHALTAAVLGSPVVSLEYFQTFGYLTRSLYAAAMLSVPLVCWWRRRNISLTALVVTMGVTLHLATPYMMHLYHMRLGSQLTNKLLILITTGLTLDALRAYLAGGTITMTRVFLSAVFSGILFVEIPSYILFFLPFVLFSLGAASSIDGVTGRCCVWIAGGLVGFFFAMFLFYGVDWRSESSAIISMVDGLMKGFPQYQPGFREQFLLNWFDPLSDYYWLQVALVIHAVVMLVLLVTTLTLWSAIGKRARYCAIVLAASFVFVCVAHTRIWATRGSYTSVFSLVYYGFFSSLLAWAILHHIRHDLTLRTWRANWCASAMVMIGVAVGVPCLITLLRYNFHSMAIMQPAQANSFRALNQLIGSLPKPINLKVTGLPEAPFLLAGHYPMAGYFYHVGTGGWNGEDARHSDQIRRERFPDFRIIWPVRAREIWYDYESWELGVDIESALPPLPASTTIATFSGPLSDVAIGALAKKVDMIPAEKLPAGTPVHEILQANPERGIIWQGTKNFPWAHWLILPLRDEPTGNTLLENGWPGSWSRDRHRFYLVRTYVGQFILALPRPALANPDLTGIARGNDRRAP